MAGTERTGYRPVMRSLSSVFAPTLAATMAAAVGKGKPGRKEEREKGQELTPRAFPHVVEPMNDIRFGAGSKND